MALKWITIILIALCGSQAVAKKRAVKSFKPFANKIHMTKVETCHVEGDAPAKTVIILKQWHLAPKTVTRGFKEKYPQEKNQTAIYQYLQDEVKHQAMSMIVSEGCEGTIDKEFKPTFNGWDVASLKGQASQKGYDKIITLAPLKIFAKYGEQVKTVCGDSDALIQEGNLRLSNLRGWMGFYTRLSEDRQATEKSQVYADSATDLLKIPRTTGRPELLKQIKDKIKVELEAFHKSLKDRDDAFVKVLQAQDFKKAAIVIGGLHADDLKEKVEKAGIGCEVLEPPGYQNDDEKLIQDFQKALE